MVELSIFIEENHPKYEGYIFTMRYVDNDNEIDKMQTFLTPNLKMGRERASEMITNALCWELANE